MISTAKAKYVRISPRKVRYVIDLIRKKSVAEARGILNGSPRRAGLIIEKLLNAAVDAAAKNSKISANDLVVSKVMADGGPSMRRFRAASMGRGTVIQKRTSHIYLELDLAKKGAIPAKDTVAHREPKQKKTQPSHGQESKKAPATKANKKLVGAK